MQKSSYLGGHAAADDVVEQVGNEIHDPEIQKLRRRRRRSITWLRWTTNFGAVAEMVDVIEVTYLKSIMAMSGKMWLISDFLDTTTHPLH